MIMSIVAALLAGLAFDASPRIESGTGDWNNIPALSSRGRHHITSGQGELLQKALESPECAAVQPERRRFELEAPFLVQFDDAGALQRIVVRDMGCRSAEGVIAGAVMRLIKLEEYRATGENPSGWYRGEIRIRFS